MLVSDNPFLLPGPDRAALAGEVAIRPRLDWRLSPVISTEAIGEISFRQYAREYGSFLTGRTRGTLRYRRNDFLSASGYLGYARELPIDGLATIDAAIDTRSVREMMTAGTAITWTPNSRTRVLGETWTERVATPGSELLSTTNLYAVRAGASRRVNTLLSLGAEAEVTTADAGPRENASTQALRLTIDRRLSSAWSADAQIGVERAVSGGIAGSGIDSFRLNGRGQMCYQPANLSICASAALRTGVSGIGGIQSESFFSTVINRQLDDSRNIIARAEYLHADLQPIEMRTKWLRGSLSYEQRLSRTMWLTSTLSHLRRRPPFSENFSGTVYQLGLSFRGDAR